MLLARMISSQKWQARKSDEKKLLKEDITADSITSDLRTINNSLSFWCCDDDNQANLEKIVLALAAGRDTIQRLDLVWIEASEVEKLDIEIAEVDGDSPAKSLNASHRDLTGIDLYRLLGLSELISVAVKTKKTRRFTQSEVEALLAKAVADKDVLVDDLKLGLAIKLGSMTVEVASKSATDNVADALKRLTDFNGEKTKADGSFEEPSARRDHLTAVRSAIEEAQVILVGMNWSASQPKPAA